MIKKSFWNTPIKELIGGFKKRLNWFFKWDSEKSDLKEKTRREPRRPINDDWTDSLQSNIELTRGLYYNTYSGLKLAGSLAYNPIVIPIWFMGLPVPKSDDETTQEMLDSLLEMFMVIIKRIHLQANRDGTCWVFPYYSAKLKKIVVEFIPDNSITDIIRDIETREVVEIITDENITISTGYNETATVRRKRYFRKDSLTVTWSVVNGVIPNELKDLRSRNSLGILPICYANNKDGGEIRGHSDLERILADLKNYHDIDLAWSKLLAKFNVKMIQDVQDVDEWKLNNGLSSLTDLNIAERDLIFNIKDRENTRFEFPQGAYDAYQKKLEQIFWKIVEGSGIPEMLWGPVTTGNHASASEQMANMVKFVQDKQEQYAESHKQLFSALLAIQSTIEMQERNQEIKIDWNALDSVSEKVRAEIFSSLASGISALINCAGFTKEWLYKFMKKTYPDFTEDTYDEFIQGLSEMAVHKQFQNASYMDALSMIESGTNDSSRVSTLI